VWQACRSFDAAGIVDRIEIAQKVLADRHRGEWIWAWGGFVMLLGEIQMKLNDPDPHIRQDAAIALADLGPHARHVIPILLDRLRSPETTFHDKTLAAWALPRIGVRSDDAIPTLLAVLEEAGDQPEAGELRRYAAEAVEHLNDSFRLLVPLARRCLTDPFWKCRLHGVCLVERLVERDRRLLPMLVPNVEPLLTDELEEVRAIAQQICERR
jgi:HEAT repeat protein